MKKFFEERNRKILDLNLLADSLGHSLRENVALFSIDDLKNKVTFVTESNNIIEGSYYLNDDIILDDIVVESGDVFVEDEKFDSVTKNQISSFIDSMYSDNLVHASDHFDALLESWGSRVKFNKTVDKLREQSEQFNNTFNIVKTDEFERFLEMSENISKFLSDNSEVIKSVPEIVNAIKLSETVSTAFKTPRMSIDKLQEEGSFKVNKDFNRDIYEMVCKQELLKKEILESKKSFDSVWVTEPCVSNLASKIYSDDDEEVGLALTEAFVNIPYLALISKKQLSNTIQNNLNAIHEDSSFSKSELKDFVSRLFEMKKPLKALVSNLLQEKYGININNLKETPTFKTLLNTQSLIFESLAKIAPRGSAVRATLVEMSNLVKAKNGVEAVDINEALKYIFNNSGYEDLYSDSPIVSTFSLNESLSEDDDIVKTILNELILEKEAVIEPEEEVEEVEAEAEVEEPESEEEVAQGMTAKELMKAFKDVEDLVSGPDMGDEE